MCSFDSNSKFEEAVYLFFQALHSPGKIKRSDIQYNEVRTFIQKFLHYREQQNISYELALNKSLQILCSKKCSNSIEIENNIKLNNTNLNCFQPPNKFYRDHYFPPTKKIVYEEDVPDPFIKVDRRTIQYKSSRKRALSNSDYIVFDCLESNLVSSFNKFYNDQLNSQKCSSSIYFYNLIVNSLAQFYSRNTWSTHVQENVINFIKNYVLKSSGELCHLSYRISNNTTNQNSNEKLREIEVMCLLELFMASLSSNLSILEDLNIIEKLQLIRYVFGEQQLKEFVVSILTPEFENEIPTLINGIYERFKIIQRKKKKAYSPIYKRKNSLIVGDSIKEENNNEEIILNKKNESSTTTTTTTKITTKITTFSSNEKILPQSLLLANSPPKVVVVDEKKCSSSSTSITTTPTSTSNANISSPAKRLSRLQPLDMEVVMQEASTIERKRARKVPNLSPIILEKKFKFSKIKKEKLLSNFEETTSNSTTTTTTTSVLPKLIKKKQQRSIIKRQSRQRSSTPPSTIKINLSSSSPPPPLPPPPSTQNNIETRKRKSIKSKESHDTDISTTTTSSSSYSTDTTPTKKSNNINNNNNNSSSTAKNAINVLTDSAIIKYKSRMEAIKLNARLNKSNFQEVFYGRGTGRQGLFDGDSIEEESQLSGSSSSNMATTSTTSRQKNRSGRSVKRINTNNKDGIYIAHTLLNVHNERPLSPFKVSQRSPTKSSANTNNNNNNNNLDSNSTFKIRKFLKLANRSERRRMEKFKKTQSLNNTI